MAEKMRLNLPRALGLCTGDTKDLLSGFLPVYSASRASWATRGVGQCAKCIAYRFKNSIRPVLLLQKVTMDASASTVCALDKLHMNDS